MKTRDGHTAVITSVTNDEYYPLRGYIKWLWVFKIDAAWTEKGEYFYDLGEYPLDIII
jgi:hypothetical protein